MRYTREMTRLEHERGKPLRVLVADALERHGDVEQAAAEFGKSGSWLYKTVRRLNGDLLNRTTVRWNGSAQ
jgi:transposase